MFVQDTKNDLLNQQLPSKRCCRHSYQYGNSLNDIIEIEKFKCEECIKYFLRSVFLTYGTITNPDKSYHLELIVSDDGIADSLQELLTQYSIEPKKTKRKNNYILYYKESELIVDFLNIIGANKSAFHIMNTKIRKELRNNANRLANCDTANIDKTVSAAMIHIDAIKTLITTGEINNLSDELKATAYLRLENPDITLNELAELHEPPISKSGVNHRLKKITIISNISKDGG